MGEDTAAANVNRTYVISGTNIAIFTFMLFFLYPRYESGQINQLLFQLTLSAMGIAAFSFVFSTLHYYLCSIDGRMSVSSRTSYSLRADRLWLLGYTMMFLTPGLVLILIKLPAVATVWIGLWLLYLVFAVRHFAVVRPQKEIVLGS